MRKGHSMKDDIVVRVATPDDVHGIMDLGMMACSENGVSAPNPEKILFDLWPSLHCDSGIVGVIGEPGQQLEGFVLLRTGTLWYSDAPILEESVYRLALCVPLAALCGPRWTIAVSGAVFAALHFVYGNPGPDNFIAGYFLAWAYLKSGTLMIPMALHALGNACVIALHVGTWYWLS